VTPGANGSDGDGECAQPNGRGEDEDRLEELHVPGARCLGPGHGVRARIRTTRFHGINASLSLSALHIRKARRPDYFVSRNEVFFSTESDMDTCSVLFVL
jgi:hypothetical protein